jgi:acylglycerol lipase
MKPHPIVISALTMICAVAPSWRIIPTPDIIDKVCKDPEMRKEVKIQLIYLEKVESEETCTEPAITKLQLTSYLVLVFFVYFFIYIQVRSNPYIYRGKLPLKTCHELLMVSLDIEKNLHQAIRFRLSLSFLSGNYCLKIESMLNIFSYSGDNAIPGPARRRRHRD